MRASVVIPCLDAPTVDRTVAAVWAQEGATPSEVIVVGRDGPGRLRGSRARVVTTPRPLLPGAARNVGAALADGDVLVFIDADCDPEPTWLAAHLLRQAAGRTVVGGGVRWDDRPYWTLADNVSMFHEVAATRPAGERRYLPTLNLSVRRSAFDAAAPMNGSMPRGEDVDWTVRLAAAGHVPYFEPSAVVWHRPARATASDVLRHWSDSGRWMVGVRRRHPDAFGGRTWLYAPAAVLALAPLIAAVATARLYRPGEPGARHPLTLPAVYLTKLAWCWGAAHPVTLPRGQGAGHTATPAPDRGAGHTATPAPGRGAASGRGSVGGADDASVGGADDGSVGGYH